MFAALEFASGPAMRYAKSAAGTPDIPPCWGLTDRVWIDWTGPPLCSLGVQPHPTWRWHPRCDQRPAIYAAFGGASRSVYSSRVVGGQVANGPPLPTADSG
jgi:hypothetical protein